MASLAKLGRLARPLFANRGVISTVNSRSIAAWNKDWMPGPYPKTPEERAAAAKRYGLRLEDYEPYPEDGAGYGDYPKLPYVAVDEKDDFTDWDDPVYKRNYGEIMHVEFDMITADRINPNDPGVDPGWKRFLFWHFAWIIPLYFYGLYGENHYKKVQPPYGPKQYVEEGVTHYTFEPADS